MDKGSLRNLVRSVSDTLAHLTLGIDWRHFVLALAVSGTISVLPARSRAESSLGLSAGRDGTLLRDGVPFRGVGVNYFDAFLRTLRHPGDDSYRDGLRKLGANGIPFARFAACGYYASDYRLYLQNKEKYFQQLDGVVKAAEESHVGLIANLFWVSYGVPDLVGEPRDQWGNPDSKTRQFMRSYTREVVARYANSPAIWGWEFGNEYNLALDFPDGLRHLPPINTRSGTPARRGPHDVLNSDIFTSALSDFAKTVRALDDHRILLTGNGAPRPSAYHMMAERRYGLDKEEQFATMLLRHNPGQFNPVCIHAGPAAIGKYFADRKVSYNELIQTCARAARSASKSLYIEEFITCRPKVGDCSVAARRKVVDEVLAALEANHVSLASVWCYDRKLVHDANSLSFNDDTASILQMIGEYDRKQSR